MLRCESSAQVPADLSRIACLTFSTTAQRTPELLIYHIRAAAMHVSLVLEHPHNSYTNLDFVNGKVLLRVPNPSTIANIVVKLEGESRTRLLAAVRPDRPDKQRPVLEVHKVCAGDCARNRRRLSWSRFSTRHRSCGRQTSRSKTCLRAPKHRSRLKLANTSTRSRSRFR